MAWNQPFWDFENIHNHFGNLGSIGHVSNIGEGDVYSQIDCDLPPFIEEETRSSTVEVLDVDDVDEAEVEELIKKAPIGNAEPIVQSSPNYGTSFESLPQHLRTEILKLVPKDQLLQLCTVSKTFMHTVHDPNLWRRISLQNLGPNFWRDVEKGSECLESVPTIDSIEFHSDNMLWYDPGFGNGSCMVLRGYFHIIDLHPEIQRLTIHASPKHDRFRYSVRLLDHIAKSILELKHVEHLSLDIYDFKDDTIPNDIFTCFLHLNNLKTLHLKLDCYDEKADASRVIPETASIEAEALLGLLRLENVTDLALLGLGWNLEEWTEFLKHDADLFKKVVTLHLGTYLHESVYHEFAKICKKTLQNLYLDDTYRRSVFSFGNELVSNKALAALLSNCAHLRQLRVRPKVRPFPEEVPVARFAFEVDEELDFVAPVEELEINFFELDRAGYSSLQRCFSGTLRSLKIVEEYRLCPIRIVVDPSDFPQLQQLHLEVLDRNARPKENQRAIVFRADDEESQNLSLKTLTLINCRIILKINHLMTRGDFLTEKSLRMIFPQTVITIVDNGRG